MIATGIAISSGHGVAITTTLRNRIGSPLAHHASAATVEGHRRIPGAELIADPTERGAPLLGLLHDLHDLRVAGIGRHPGRRERSARRRR